MALTIIPRPDDCLDPPKSNVILNPLLLPTDALNVKKRRVIKTF